MDSFIRTIRSHRIIILAVLAAALVALMIFIGLGGEDSGSKGSEKESSPDAPVVNTYYEDSDYPVKITDSETTMTVELTANTHKELGWDISYSDNKTLIAKGGKEEEGKLSIKLTPKAAGYVTMLCKRSSTLMDIPYDAVTTRITLVTAADDEGRLTISLSDISQSTCLTGAEDTDAPYLISENKVYIEDPSAWTLTPEVPESLSPEIFVIYQGSDENDHQYYSVTADYSLAENEEGVLPQEITETRLILENKDAGVKIKLELIQNEAMNWALRPAEE
ncbi:MAG: hypothetical protein IJ129_05860 [Ruminococcus sp.]|nr:hypothetical protein [Ruminococcus sp.]